MKYRAVVIDGKRIWKNTLAYLFTSGILFILFICLISGNTFFFPSGEDMISTSIPAIGVANNLPEKRKEVIQNTSRQMLNLLFGFSPSDSRTILDTEYPLLKAVTKAPLVSKAIGAETKKSDQNLPAATAPVSTAVPPEQQNINPENARPIKAINACPNKDGSKKIVISNETDYSIDVDQMLSESLNIDLSVPGPKILVVHTHATEAYALDGAAEYDKTASDRSEDINKNVVKVGEEVTKIFNAMGIETIHDTKLHDVPSFNGSYSNSLKTVEEKIKQYPSIQIVFDIHRDSVVYADETKARAVTEINGRAAAQLMFVVGTDARGLYHPNWQENMKFAVHMQNAINQKYPSLMRYINLRTERFNGHTTGASMIIEVGTSGNSLNEAIYGATLAAQVIAEEIKK